MSNSGETLPITSGNWLINAIIGKELDFEETGCVPLWINNAHPKLKLIQPELENEFAIYCQLGTRLHSSGSKAI